MRVWTGIVFTLLGITAIAAGWFYESRWQVTTGKAELAIPDHIDYFMTRLTYRSMTKAGQPDFIFRSPRLEHHKTTNVSHIQLPSMEIFRDSGLWMVNALRGEYEHGDNMLHLIHEVVMQRKNDRPIEIRSNRMRFEPDIDRITSESHILIESATSRIEAEQAVFDLAGRIYSMRNAKTIFYHDQG